MSEINVALIGYAFMGRAHSNAYRQVGPFFNPKMPPRMKVICGRSPKGVEAARKALGWEEAATDWREVVKRDDIDLVDICTPGDSHVDIAIAAAKAGKNVFCEKPLANSLKDAERMLVAVERAGVAHMICHNYRRAPAVQLAKQLIASGQLGEIRHYRGTYLQDWMSDPAAPFNWRLDRTVAGSGALGDIASHSIDLARFLVGEITEVTADLKTFVTRRAAGPKAAGRTTYKTVTVDDAAQALVRFKNGAIGTIEATRMAPGRKNFNRFEINGLKGSLAFDLERMNELEVYFESDPPHLRGFRTIMVTEGAHPFVGKWWPPGHIIGYEHTFTHTVFDLLEGVRTGKVPTPNFADGVANQRVLDAMTRAAKSRRWVTV
ncbi:MAG: oxidoreductase [Acidimicrobiia bacterium]|jgi:predicted dehydrogenase